MRDAVAGGAPVEKRKPMEKLQNIQDGFLNALRRDKAIVTIYLVSGVKLSGRIRSFDKFAMILESNGQEQLIFKHAISTVMLNRSGTAPTTPTATGGS
jgi:host factor-I protein